MELNKIIQGHILDIAPSIPNDSMSCMVTSPPYWAKRNYTGEGIIWDSDTNCKHRWNETIVTKMRHRDGQSSSTIHCTESDPFNTETAKMSSKYQFCVKCGAWKGQLGHEPTVALYIQHLMQIFDEMYRILRKDGNLFVVIADTRSRGTRPKQSNWEDSLRKPGDESSEPDLKPDYKLPSKSQCCVPEIFKLAMMSCGWIARSTYIWIKTNPKPESVKDRFTDCFEYIYHFIKHKRYFFDTQYEPAVDSVDTLRQMRGAFIGSIQPYKGAHFATYPEWLIEPLIKAGCPTRICKKCNKIAVPIYETRKVKRERLHDTTEPCKEAGQSPNDYAGVVGYTSKFTNGKFGEAASGLSSGARFEKERAKSRDIAKELYPNDPKAQQEHINFIHEHGRCITGRKLVDYDTCNCDAGFRTGVTFDPFMGAGTTAVVAEKLGFDWSGIELSKQYIKMSYRRLSK